MHDGFLGGLVRRYGWRRLQVIAWICTATGVLLIIPISAFLYTTRTFWGGLTIYSGSLLLCLGLPGTIIIPSLRRHDTILDPDPAYPSQEALLVEHQPIPDLAALTLPATIDMMMRKHLARLMTMTTWLILLVFLVIWRGFFPVVMFALLTLGIVVSIVKNHDVIVGEEGQRVRVSEDEIAVSSNSARHESIAWDDVHVFALIQDGHGLYTAKVYLLSSGEKEVRWAHRPHTHWYSLTKPTTSDEDYQRQMGALLSYTAARTGLPLLDLR